MAAVAAAPGPGPSSAGKRRAHTRQARRRRRRHLPPDPSDRHRPGRHGPAQPARDPAAGRGSPRDVVPDDEPLSRRSWLTGAGWRRRRGDRDPSRRSRRNAAGGYDGYDARFGYALKDAIPRGRRPYRDIAGKPRHRGQRRRSRRRRHRVPAHPWHVAGRAARRAVRWELRRRERSRSALHTSPATRRHRHHRLGMLHDAAISDGRGSGRRADRSHGRSAAIDTLPGPACHCAHLRAHSDVRVDGLRRSDAANAVPRAERDASSAATRSSCSTRSRSRPERSPGAGATGRPAPRPVRSSTARRACRATTRRRSVDRSVRR